MALGSGLFQHGSAGCLPDLQAFGIECGPACEQTWEQNKRHVHHSQSWWAATHGTWGLSQSNSARTGKACKPPPHPVTPQPPEDIIVLHKMVLLCVWIWCNIDRSVKFERGKIIYLRWFTVFTDIQVVAKPVMVKLITLGGSHAKLPLWIHCWVAILFKG